MTTWTTDSTDRLVTTDPRTGTRYRVGQVKAGWQLAVYLQGERRSCDRHLFDSARAAKAHAIERIQHDIELTALGRTTRQSTVRTPWGKAMSATTYGDGIELFSTSDNDGYRLSPALNAAIPESLRIADGWYEEDRDGPRVILGIPDYFTALEVQQATAAAMDLYPDLYDEFVQTVSGPAFGR